MLSRMLYTFSLLIWNSIHIALSPLSITIVCFEIYNFEWSIRSWVKLLFEFCARKKEQLVVLVYFLLNVSFSTSCLQQWKFKSLLLLKWISAPNENRGNFGEQHRVCEKQELLWRKDVTEHSRQYNVIIFFHKKRITVLNLWMVAQISFFLSSIPSFLDCWQYFLKPSAQKIHIEMLFLAFHVDFYDDVFCLHC